MESDTESLDQERYFAYLSKQHKMQWIKDDQVPGGTKSISSWEGLPIAEATNLHDIYQKIYAYLGQNFKDYLYLVNSKKEVVEYIYNKEYCKEVSWYDSHLSIAWSIFALCFFSFIGTIITSVGSWGLVFFAVAVALYFFCVYSKIANEIESVVACAIILVLLFLLVPAIQAFRDAKNESTTKQDIKSIMKIEFKSIYLSEINKSNSDFNFPKI